MVDLASRYGTSYQEPSDIWFAEWNGVANTNSTLFPPTDWTNHTRLHQYVGGANQTYGGMTINIDEDYLDGSTYGNPRPSCFSTSATTTIDTAVSVKLRCRDAAGAQLTYILQRPPAHGSLSGFNSSTGTVTYTPNSGYTGSDTFTYLARSVNGTSAGAVATMTVN
jgi:hypothetical protein